MAARVYGGLGYGIGGAPVRLKRTCGVHHHTMFFSIADRSLARSRANGVPPNCSLKARARDRLRLVTVTGQPSSINILAKRDPNTPVPPRIKVGKLLCTKHLHVEMNTQKAALAITCRIMC